MTFPSALAIKLNAAQSRHMAVSLRAYGLGQLAAFGYTGIQSGDGVAVFISVVVLLIFEVGALFAIKDVEDLP